jgi:hypothetical protein
MKTFSIALLFTLVVAAAQAVEANFKYATLTLVTDVTGNSRVYLDEAMGVRMADVVPATTSGTQSSGDARKTLAQLLNTLGAEGWELVAVVSAQPSTTQYVFKQVATAPPHAAGKPRSPFTPSK